MLAVSEKMEKRDESHLIIAMAGGSEQAFNEIYERYAHRLYAFSLRFCKSGQEAEEIVEDVFIRLWQSRNRVKRTDTVKPLLFMICRHRLIDALRKCVNDPSYATYLECREAIAPESADEQIEYDQFVERLYKAIQQLPLTQQKILRLSKWEGMTNQEIASETGLSLQTVKNQLSLAIKELRKKLGALVALLFLFY